MTSHMKKKAKRYQEGGEAEDKKRGLGASKDDKVGFFERLRMGNIDDPKSEAYKRFGAGRGQAETTKEKKAIKSYKGSANPFQGDDVDPFSAVRKPSGEIMREPAKAAPKMNFGQAFAAARKRGDKTFEFNGKKFTTQVKGETKKPKAATTRGPSRGTQDEGDAGEEAARKAKEAKMAKAREMRKQTDPGDVPADVRRTQEASAKSKRRDMTGFAQMPFSEQMKYLSTKGKEGTGFKTKEGSTKKKDEMGDYTPFKKGGKVSSASKRGDGIAMRGKTKGRMV